MLCGTSNIMWSILHIQYTVEEYSTEYCQSTEHCYACEC